MQSFVGKVLVDAFKEANVVMDVDHSRRLIRVLLRAAARLSIAYGVPLPALVAAATAEAMKEGHTQNPAIVPTPVLPNEPHLHLVPEKDPDELN